jgi:hypothetical protein
MRGGWERLLGIIALVLLAIPLIAVIGIIFRIFRLNPFLWSALVGITWSLGKYGEIRLENAAAHRAEYRAQLLLEAQAEQHLRATGQTGTTGATGQAGYGRTSPFEDDEGRPMH